MATHPAYNAALVIGQLSQAGPQGLSAEQLGERLPGLSRSTITRQLRAFIQEGSVRPVGGGRAVRYRASSFWTRADIDAYFETPANARPVARFHDEWLEPWPAMDPERARRCQAIQALRQPVDQRFLSHFLVDFAWGSSVLEGSSYSALDTAALLRYGQKNDGKPIEDAVLALNHKLAGAYLWDHRELSVENVCAMQAMLTDDHGLPAVAGSDHFLPEHERGRPREYQEVSLADSAYLPPFRPGTGHAAALLARITATARTLEPMAAALYLLTRVAYAQSFANGNKRTARIASNLPLLAHGLLPSSFADIDKGDYIRGMAAFYELGSLLVIERCFIHGYVRSVIRGSDIPAALRAGGFDVAGVAESLVDFIYTGTRPKAPAALALMGG